MSTSTLIAFLAMLFVGVPAGLRMTDFRVSVRNPVALAMVVMWFVGQGICAAATRPLQFEEMVKIMVVSDTAVIASMFLKEEWINCTYLNGWHQLACLWHERTPWDKGILALFPLAWLFYMMPPSDFQYWMLWGIGMTQLALAGHEAFHFWQRAKGQSLQADATRDTSRSFFAPVLGEAHV